MVNDLFWTWRYMMLWAGHAMKRTITLAKGWLWNLQSYTLPRSSVWHRLWERMTIQQSCRCLPFVSESLWWVQFCERTSSYTLATAESISVSSSDSWKPVPNARHHGTVNTMQNAGFINQLLSKTMHELNSPKESSKEQSHCWIQIIQPHW